ncbi:MAG: hypothetical protein KDD50_00440 [Bdellovibrionales bacterium]|nr:hypothetical protein [Bdellovibrionales bacterium]
MKIIIIIYLITFSLCSWSESLERKISQMSESLACAQNFSNNGGDCLFCTSMRDEENRRDRDCYQKICKNVLSNKDYIETKLLPDAKKKYDKYIEKYKSEAENFLRSIDEDIKAVIDLAKKGVAEGRGRKSRILNKQDKYFSLSTNSYLVSIYQNGKDQKIDRVKTKKSFEQAGISNADEMIEIYQQALDQGVDLNFEMNLVFSKLPNPKLLFSLNHQGENMSYEGSLKREIDELRKKMSRISAETFDKTKNTKEFYKQLSSALKKEENGKVLTGEDIRAIAIGGEMINVVEFLSSNPLVQQYVVKDESEKSFSDEEWKEFVDLTDKWDRFMQDPFDVKKIRSAIIQDCADLMIQNLAILPTERELESFKKDVTVLKGNFLNPIGKYISLKSSEKFQSILENEVNIEYPQTVESLMQTKFKNVSEARASREVDKMGNYSIYKILSSLAPNKSGVIFTPSPYIFLDVCRGAKPIETKYNGANYFQWDHIELTPMVIKRKEGGLLVIAHEIGHSLDHAMREGKLSKETMGKFKPINECLMRMHPEFKRVQRPKHVIQQKVFSSEFLGEDFADLISFHLYPNSVNLWCINKSSAGLNLKGSKSDPHSTKFFRILHEATVKKRFPPECEAELASQNEAVFMDCLDPKNH